MLQSFLLLPLSVIPVIVPVRSQIDTVPSAYVQVAEVPLPQLPDNNGKCFNSTRALTVNR
jgi:hypothetical protein